MKYSKASFYQLALFAILVQLVYSFPQNSPLQSSEFNFRPRCGETYVTVTGGVFYKPFEQVLENERCAWVINVPGALGYSINVQFLSTPTNQNSSGQGLILTGFTWNDTEPVNMTNYLPTSVGKFNIEDTNVIVATFFSSEQQEGTQNTGIVLEYEALFEGTENMTAIGASSTQYIFEPPVFDFLHPQVGATYGPGELAFFILPPQNNIYTAGHTNTGHALVGALEGVTCNDSLFVFKLQLEGTNTTTDPSWEDAGRICGNNKTTTFTHDDMMLVLFQSSLSYNYAGFYLDFTSC